MSNVKEQQRLIKIGKKVRMKRLLADFDQDQLAERAKTNRKTISYIESGTRNAGISMLFNIADALKCPITDLITD